MRTLKLFFCGLIAAFMSMPAPAMECSNSGTPTFTAPDDEGDWTATACGEAAKATGVYSTALGKSALSFGDSSTALGDSTFSFGGSSTALGHSANSAGSSSIALGHSASSDGGNSTALGHDATSSGSSSTALGYDATSSGGSSTALGRSAFATGSSSVALGYLSQASNISSIAIGQSSAAAGAYGAALGYGSSAAADNGVALGFSAKAEGINSTALGALALANQPNTVVLGSATGVNGAADYANIGMGTSAPIEAVDVERSATAARFQLTSFTSTANEAPQYIQRRARGTKAAPTAVQNNDNLGLFSFRGYNGESMGGSRATITAQAAGTFSASSTPTRLIFSTTPVGQTTPQSVLVITPDGKVQVKGVNLTVPDYVFEDGYELMPLDELKTFIDENGHLPGIASAQQVKDEGLDLAGSQMSQLQKIEELTLYTLHQEQRLKELQAKSDRLEAMVNQLMQDRDKS